MNIMLVSVTERTREIGLKIAIGAQQSRIRLQFLTEAAVLTSMGGILGVGCGIGLAEMMSHVMSTPVAISVPACIIAVAFSMVIGVVFGFVPAVKASKLNPIELCAANKAYTKRKTCFGRSSFLCIYQLSSCAGTNTSRAMSVSTVSEAPLSTVRP